MRVLVVDPSAVMRSMLIRTLQRSGLPLVAIAQAQGGLAALDLLGREAFDLVLVDHTLPDMSAAELVEAIMAQPAWSRVAWVVIGGDADTLPARGVGGISLPKPFTPDDVRSAVLASLAAGEPGAP